MTKGTTAATTQTFNGLTLENNASKNVTVNIAAPLQNGTSAALNGIAGNGITAYNLGQLTTHGVTDLSIAVANELAPATAGKASATTTTIANIWDRDLVNLKLTATGNVNVGTVTGNTTNNNLKTFDASAVVGNTTAIVKALGDAAVVTLSGGNDNFDALGSAGNNIVINGGNGTNTIRGSAQSDIITTGTGNDFIDADRGNNTVKAGAGNDIVIARNGNNTVDLGSGLSDKALFIYDTAAQLALGTNVIAGTNTSGFITFTEANITTPIDAANFDTTVAGATVAATYGFAVGQGAELSIKFTGINFDAAASTLNGRSAIVEAGGAFAGVQAAQSNLLVKTADSGTAVVGGSAADVFLDLSNGTTGYNVSTGAGNDAIVISQESAGAHTINAGAGADKIVLAAIGTGGVDTLEIGAGDSTAAARDVVTNFEAGTDLLKTGAADTAATLTAAAIAVGTIGTGLRADFDVNGGVTVFDTVAGANVVIGAPGSKVSVDSLLSFLSTATATNNAVFSFQADTNGDGVISAADSTFAVQHGSVDTVVELVGAYTSTQVEAAFV